MSNVRLVCCLALVCAALAAPGRVGARGGPPTGTPGAEGAVQVYHGTISGLEASSLTITLADGSSVVIGLAPETKTKIPGGKHSGGALEAGMRVIVQTYLAGSGDPIAKMVLAIPGQPIHVHRVGEVIAYTPGSTITIKAVDGNNYTFNLTSETRILPPPRGDELAVGSLVTIIAPRDPSSEVWTATGIVVRPASP
jgi:hypothetical protein